MAQLDLQSAGVSVTEIDLSGPRKVEPVGIPAGPLTVGPIKAAPISPTAVGKKVRSISFVNTPGDTIKIRII